MQCERCNALINEKEEKKFHGEILCEDCLMDLFSQGKACDPWAVYSAKMSMQKQGTEQRLKPVQEKILQILSEKGPMEAGELSDYLQIKDTDLQRELVVLRHMEKVRSELRDKRRLVRLWD